MQEGHFFKLDRDSLPHEGQVIFRYLPVQREKDSEKSLPYYPVYLVLKPHALEFYYNGTAQESKEHVHIRLLDIPLTPNLTAEDNATDILVNIYRKTFLLGKHYQNKVGDSVHSFWNLSPFYSEDIYRKIIEDQFPDSSDTGIDKYIFFRKLVLDFLFDLEHTGIFENSPYYQDIVRLLLSNPFFSAIRAKSAYYYDRQNYINNRADNDARLFYAKKLEAAEKRWLNLLLAESTCELFMSAKENWFHPVEQEYSNVLFNKNKFDRSRWRRLLEGKDKQVGDENMAILRKSASWYLRRYNFKRAAISVLQYREDKKPTAIGLGILAFLLVLLLGSLYHSDWLENSKDYFGDAVFYASYGMLGVVVGSISILVIYRRFLLPIIGLMMPRLIMAIASTWIFFTTSEELWKISFDVSFSEEWWIVLLILPVSSFMILELKRIAPDVKTKELFPRAFIILVIGFFFSLLIGTIFIHATAERMLCRSGYLENYYRDILIENSRFRFDSTAVHQLPLGSMNNEALSMFKKEMAKGEFKNKKEYESALRKALGRGVINDTLTNAIYDSATSIYPSGDLGDTVLACCIGVTDSKNWVIARLQKKDSVLYNLIKQKYSNYTYHKNLTAKLVFFHYYRLMKLNGKPSFDLLSKVPVLREKDEEFDFITNVDTQSLFSNLKYVKYELMEGVYIANKYEVPLFYREDDYYPYEDKAVSMNIFPGMLLLRSIFALFIGIFIQLVFENKPITETL